MRQLGSCKGIRLGGGSLFQGLRGFFLDFAAGVSEMEKFVLPHVWATHRSCAPRSLCCKAGTVLSKKAWNSDGGRWRVVEKQMYVVCWSKQCSCFKIGPLSSTVMAMQINTSSCWLFFLFSNHHPRTWGLKVEKSLGGHQIPCLPLSYTVSKLAPTTWGGPQDLTQVLSMSLVNYRLSVPCDPQPLLPPKSCTHSNHELILMKNWSQ